jgi:hypothetical protein
MTELAIVAGIPGRRSTQRLDLAKPGVRTSRGGGLEGVPLLLLFRQSSYARDLYLGRC